MTITTRLLDRIWPPSPPPAGGWLNDLPEAFGALNEHGDVYVIGYKGEWFVVPKLSLSTRLHNWIVGKLNERHARRYP